MITPMNADSVFCICQSDHAVSGLMLVLYAFSGTGGALLLSWITTAKTNKKERNRKSERKQELLKLVLDEINVNTERLAQMVSNPHFRPYWMLSTRTFDSVVNELASLLASESSILRDMYARYRVYHLINRQLDLMHYRKEGLKASIYLDSTLPLAESEFPRSERFRNDLADQLDVTVSSIRVEQPYSPDDEDLSYDDLSRIYMQAWDDIEVYWDILASYGEAMFNAVRARLACDEAVLRVAQDDDQNGRMSPGFFRTTHFRHNEDGTYRFRIQLLFGEREKERLFTIPIIMWISNHQLQVRVKDGEYKFAISTEGELGIEEVASKLIAILAKLLRNNIRSIEPV